MADAQAWPRLLNREALLEALRREYTPDLRRRGLAGFVLLDLDIDATGAVTRAVAIDQRIPAGMRLMLGEEPVDLPSGEPPSELKRLVERAAKVMRFRPREREGEPQVTHGLRMSIPVTPGSRWA